MPCRVVTFHGGAFSDYAGFVRHHDGTRQDFHYFRDCLDFDRRSSGNVNTRNLTSKCLQVALVHMAVEQAGHARSPKPMRPRLQEIWEGGGGGF